MYVYYAAFGECRHMPSSLIPCYQPEEVLPKKVPNGWSLSTTCWEMEAKQTRSPAQAEDGDPFRALKEDRPGVVVLNGMMQASREENGINTQYTGKKGNGISVLKVTNKVLV